MLVLSPCYLLHYYESGAHDRVVQVFSRDQGKISCMVKAARQSAKIKRGLLQPFIPLSLEVVAAKNDWYIVSGISALKINIPANSMQGRILYSAYYLNELLLRLLAPYLPDEILFQHYHDTLQNLYHKPDNLEYYLRLFELNLLEQLGYQPNWTLDSIEHYPIDSESDYVFDPLSGPRALALQPRDKRLPICSGRLLYALQEKQLDNPRILKQAKLLLRQILRYYLGDKPLRSRQVYQQLVTTHTQ